MTMNGTPGAVRPYQVAPAQKEQTGLVRMTPGSSHLLNLANGPAYVLARDYLAVPSNVTAAAKHFCQHPTCAAKSWASFDEMRVAHGDSGPAGRMAKARERHVYGLWSDQLIDPEAAPKTKTELERAQRIFDKARANDETSVEKLKILEDRLTVAKAAHAESLGCYGLISPPEP